MAVAFDPHEVTLLRELSRQFPTADAAVAEVAAAKAGQGLAKGVIHVVSDVHGEYRKLRHVINNASGNLRPMVESLFAGRLDEPRRRQLLTVLYYPRETMDYLKPQLADAGCAGTGSARRCDFSLNWCASWPSDTAGNG